MIYHPKETTGNACLRFTIPTSAALNDPVASRVISDDFRMFTFNGDQKRIIAYAVDYAQQLNFNCTHPVEMSSQQTSGGENADAIGENQSDNFNSFFD
jgi:hypothetical protein